MITITLNGEPVGKERPRFGKGRVYTPGKTKAYETSLAWAAHDAMREEGETKPFEGPVRVSVVAMFDGLGRGWHTSRPDIDNVLKIVLDALNKIVWKDDAAVAHVSIMKVYGTRPQLAVSVEQL